MELEWKLLDRKGGIGQVEGGIREEIKIMNGFGYGLWIEWIDMNEYVYTYISLFSLTQEL